MNVGERSYSDVSLTTPSDSGSSAPIATRARTTPFSTHHFLPSSYEVMSASR